ncbi:MAG: hypothetical protein GXN93_01935 [Candidatus Diapherotrites archaeon]|nr:hypothetical protein [Candidatus Diapherotrites archaeon]
MHIHIIAEEHYEEMPGKRDALKEMFKNYRRLSNALKATGDKMLILAEPYIEVDHEFAHPKHRIVARLGKLAENATILPMDNQQLRVQNAAQLWLIQDLQDEKTQAMGDRQAVEKLAHAERIKMQEFLETANARSKTMAKNIVKALKLVKRYPELRNVRRIVAIVGAEHAPEVAGHIVEMLGNRVGEKVYIHGNGVEPSVLNAKGDVVLHIHDVTADQKIYKMFLQD